jgi:ABC-type polysaccharide/polyol phosphate transport system ATPase subunit
MNNAVEIDGVWKSFRRYHEKNQYLKSAILRGGRARYEEFWALQDVTASIAHGETFGIIGRNGSGKSTLLKCLSGILAPDKGSLRINGRIAPLLELGAGFHPDLSGRENIYLNGAILGMTQKEIQRKYEAIVDFADIGQFIDSPVKNYSSGMAVRLGFAIAINVDPEILIIDEVLAVGDTAFQQKCHEKIEDFRKAGHTILIVSHGLGDISRLCKNAIWLEQGAVRMYGPATDVVNEYNGMSHAARPRVEGELGQRWGSGEVSIVDVSLRNMRNTETTKFHSGKPMSISVVYTSDISLDNCCVAVRITELHGTEVWGTTSERQGVNIPITRGEGSLTLGIADLPLLQGTYDISVSISDHGEIHEFDHWEKRTRFEVVQDTMREDGLIHLNTSWTY